MGEKSRSLDVGTGKGRDREAVHCDSNREPYTTGKRLRERGKRTKSQLESPLLRLLSAAGVHHRGFLSDGFKCPTRNLALAARLNDETKNTPSMDPTAPVPLPSDAIARAPSPTLAPLCPVHRNKSENPRGFSPVSRCSRAKGEGGRFDARREKRYARWVAARERGRGALLAAEGRCKGRSNFPRSTGNCEQKGLSTFRSWRNGTRARRRWWTKLETRETDQFAGPCLCATRQGRSATRSTWETLLSTRARAGGRASEGGGIRIRQGLLAKV